LSPVIVLPGVGNMDLSMFAAPGDTICFRTIGCPGWRRFLDTGFSLEVLVGELASQIPTIVAQGPIRILGFSIGGHFGYAAAFRLSERHPGERGFMATGDAALI
jgi:thioesterase domain-containing protein